MSVSSGDVGTRGYEPIDLATWCNAGLDTVDTERRPSTGAQTFHGIPFTIGSGAGAEAEPCFVRLSPGTPAVTVPVGRTADRIVVAHRRLRRNGPEDDPIPGTTVARYRFDIDGSPDTIPIRERFEIAAAADEGWDSSGPFLAGSSVELELLDRYVGRWEDVGARQEETLYRSLPDWFLWVWESPRPDVPVASVTFESEGGDVLVGGITIGNLGEDPFPLEAARTVVLRSVGADGPRPLREPTVEVDRGETSYAFRLPEEGVEPLSKDPFVGWGEPIDPQTSRAYARILAVPSATVVVKDGEDEVGRFRWGDLDLDAPVKADGLTAEIAEEGRNWVHVTVLDDDTGRPVPCRIAFRSPDGVPYQPYGHHDHVNSDLGTWHIDIGGDLRLGRLSYAYIDGTCQGWLPRGEVFVDVARGFEYEPLRERVTIAPGQRELTLRMKRWTSMNDRGWYSGDSHVHFLSAQGALTEQLGEDLNVVNLLQSQWGSLFTSTEEFTGGPHASADGRFVTWVSQENRQPFFGHLVLWGLKQPVMPWCTSGPNEAEMGAWLESTISEWADRCHEQGGTVVIPHFPLPNGEPAVLIATERVDAIEMIVQRRSFHEEYYRYLNTGYPLPLVGGTDKMSADVPVGVYRTYTNLGDEGFSFDRWCEAVRAGRTFLSGGPIIDLEVEGRGPGATVHLSSPGRVHVRSWAESIFPIWTLQLVHDGRVVAAAEDPHGTRRLELDVEVEIPADGWLAARCGGPHYWDAPSHYGPWERGVFAHTSPVYVATGAGPWSRFDPGHAAAMEAMIEGGLERIRRRSRRYPEDRITHHHGEEDHQAFLERPFLEALERIRERLGSRLDR
jgi:hypothetical protein